MLNFVEMLFVKIAALSTHESDQSFAAGFMEQSVLIWMLNTDAVKLYILFLYPFKALVNLSSVQRPLAMLESSEEFSLKD